MEDTTEQVRRWQCSCGKWLSIVCILNADESINGYSLWVPTGPNQGVYTVGKRSRATIRSFAGRCVSPAFQFVHCLGCSRKCQVRKFRP